MKINKYLIFLLFLTAIGFATRIYKLSSVPAEMHRDEIAIGYNAYSILNTSRDEYGNGPFPKVFESYGDNKLPGLVYAVIPSIFFFGLNEFSVRLPTALFATAMIPLAYLFMYEISKEKKLALIAAALLTFSTWHTFLSRTAYEPIAGLTLSLLSLLFFLYAKNGKKYYFLSLIFFILSFFFYNISQLLVLPILVIATAIYRKKRDLRSDLVFLFLIILSVSAVLVFLSTNTKNRVETTIFSSQSKDLESINKARLSLHEEGFSPIFSRLLFGPEAHLVEIAAKNYLAAFNPVYLFSSGGNNAWHNLSGIGLGNINPITGILFLIGLFQLLKVRNNMSLFLIGYLLLAPIPDAMTIDAPVTNRLLDLHFAILLIASFGIFYLLQHSKRLFINFCFLFSIFYFQFIARYYLLHSHTLDPQWGEGTKEMATILKDSQSKYDRIYISDAGISPTIYSSILFYSEYDPEKLQREANWFRGNDFHYAVNFSPYELTHLSLAEVEKQASVSAEKSLYVVRRDEGFAEVVIGQRLD